MILILKRMTLISADAISQFASDIVNSRKYFEKAAKWKYGRTVLL